MDDETELKLPGYRGCFGTDPFGEEGGECERDAVATQRGVGAPGEVPRHAVETLARGEDVVGRVGRVGGRRRIPSIVEGKRKRRGAILGGASRVPSLRGVIPRATEATRAASLSRHPTAGSKPRS